MDQLFIVAVGDHSQSHVPAPLPRMAGLGFVLAILLCFAAPARTAPPLPTFVDVSSAAGLVSDRKRSWGSPLWADLNLDGHLDLIVPNHGPSPWVYLNDGNGHFTLVVSGLINPNVWSDDWHGLALGDYDGDGFPDLSVAAGNPGVSSLKEDSLWRGLGNGSFSNVTAVAGVQNFMGRGRQHFWFDYDGDGDLDLFEYNYDTPNRLYRNDGGGRFTDVAAAAGVDGVGAGGGVSMIDYNADGRLDFFMTDIALLNRGDGTFERIWPAGLGIVKARNLAWADFNRDGFPDLYAMQSDPLLIAQPRPDRLYMNVAGSSFVDVTATAGVSLPILSTSVSWADFDNDGWVDLFVLGVGATALDVGRKNRLYRNNGDGTFTDVAESVGLANPEPGERPSAASWADYDGDGNLDLVIKYGHGVEAKTDVLAVGPARLYRNLGNGNHYLKIALAGSPSNASGLGARVELTTTSGTQYQQMTGGSHQFGQDAAPLHFGLGSAASAGLVVRWPSGKVQSFQEILGDRRFVANESVDPLQLVSLKPSQVTLGTKATLNITGAAFTAASVVSFSPSSGITIVEQRFSSPTQLQVSIQIDASATNRWRDLIVTNPDGQRAIRVRGMQLM